MKELRTEIDIHAPVSVVWQVLTEFDQYPEWNPFITSLTGEIAPGERFRVTLQPPGSRAMTFRPVCTHLSENRRFSWRGNLIFPGLFDGEHIFEMTEIKNETTRFIQRENFSGILLPMLWKQLNTKTKEGFELMNQKLKERCEEQFIFKKAL
ncbi:SRPBCC domain-containing protein [Rhodohalobacter sp. SW132]|uniref:SRPBCC domain-containing protein n=1 Tax=Rhodohalobacter sp. SW132 TaxID=2293433 RepID=UPI000E246AE1|nr:SRPBCC domain-containing protein [Rhodohalobacter sp. SW132]REL24284.1 SRPBCC domain-containing protein [Rhodohalobacter sp. SW132]